MKRSFISVGTLEALGHGVSVRDSVLKMTRGSMVVLKGVRRNNQYYLMGSTVTGRVTISISSDGDCTHIWHMRFGHTGEKSLQALVKKGSLEGASICNMKVRGHSVLDKKTKVKFGTLTAWKVFLIVFT